jgi:hypothetical protein
MIKPSQLLLVIIVCSTVDERLKAVIMRGKSYRNIMKSYYVPCKSVLQLDATLV